MKQIKYSRQREAIKNFLMSRNDHPTADFIYNNVRTEFPNISLGTVYRNLSLLVEMGEAIKVPSTDGCEHFDGDTSKHYHFICNKCSCIKDLQMGNIDIIDSVASSNFEGEISGHTAYFYGLCPECKIN